MEKRLGVNELILKYTAHEGKNGSVILRAKINKKGYGAYYRPKSCNKNECEILFELFEEAVKEIYEKKRKTKRL